MKDLLIFDLDGTIIDSAEDFHDSLKTLLKRYDAPPMTLEETKKYIGNGFNGFVERFETNPAPNRIKELFNEFLEVYEEHFLTKTNLFDGVKEFLHNTKNPIALCTNKPTRYAIESLKRFDIYDLPWVAYVCGDTFKDNKPNPEGVEHILKISKTNPSNAIMIGDGVPDALVAENAGIDFLGVGFGYHPPEELIQLGAKGIIECYHSIDQTLEKLRS